MNSNKVNFDPLINLKQGAEFLKYGNVNKINIIEHLNMLQKTSAPNLDSMELYSSNHFNPKLLENYKHVSDYKAYTKEQGLFNKTVSEYIMTQHAYIRDTGNNKLLSMLIRLNDKLLNHASNISKSLTKMIITDTTLEKDMMYHKKHIDDSIEYLRLSANNMKPLEKGDNGDSLEILLNEWYSVGGVGIFVLLIVMIMSSKMKEKGGIILFCFAVITITVISWLTRHIIL
jgi:hypothetical protein|tara:strand:+ start:271 stop:960 length:690 start_codon:yes stop_codon:yes gene_type:complete